MEEARQVLLYGKKEKNMTYIPDVRKKKIQRRFQGEAVDNPYWEGNLSVDDKVVLMAYDKCFEGFENGLANVSLSDELERAGVDVDLLEDVLKEPNDPDLIEALNNANHETQAVFDFIIYIENWMEMQRNEMVVSLIESENAEDDE